MNPNSVTAALLETALNAFLKLDNDASAQLDALSGKVIQLSVLGLGVEFYILPFERQVRVQSDYEGQADTRITGSPAGFVRQGFASMSGNASNGELEIQGDIGTGLIFQKALSQIEFDWEEALAKRLGDIPAHQLGNLLRGVTGWFRSASESTRLDASEYLQEEARLTPGRLELENFLSASDTLRGDIDRFEARLRRLETHIPASGTAHHAL